MSLVVVLMYKLVVPWNVALNRGFDFPNFNNLLYDFYCSLLHCSNFKIHFKRYINCFFLEISEVDNTGQRRTCKRDKTMLILFIGH
jgi:hypothetical protein